MHGYTGSGTGIDSFLNLTTFAASKGFLYCLPEGLMKGAGRGWNAWFDDPLVASSYTYPRSDDVGLIRGIIQSVAFQFSVDRKRVYIIGTQMAVAWLISLPCKAQT